MPERNDEKFVRDALGRLPVEQAPDSIWHSIQTSIDASLDAPARVPARPLFWPRSRWAFAAAAAVLIAGIAIYWRSANRPRWEVKLTSAGKTSQEAVRAGDWLQTDASSTAEVRVGTIGTVEVSPRTRLRIVTTRPDEHRISLQHGQIKATISAPPRLFFVDTKSATAVDLGCQYTMNVDDYGNGLLNVTLGWVAFEWRGRESLVPAGAQCRTHANAGPGTPYFEDAPKAFINALEDFDFSNGGEASVRTMLVSARQRDTLTLWHLLSRVAPPLRAQVFDKMTSFAPLPKGLTREKVLALDPPTLETWKNELAWTW
ncbi:MAG TPA: FecR domain-containing protein [Bryobacteraceae bacterium]|nr:FecR domain-containing protein [Bryobacteraceae bacterium]